MVSSAVELSVPEEVDEVDEQLLAHAAGEAARVPTGSGASTGREHAHVTLAHSLIALEKRKKETLSLVAIHNEQHK